MIFSPQSNATKMMKRIKSFVTLLYIIREYSSNGVLLVVSRSKDVVVCLCGTVCVVWCGCGSWITNKLKLNTFKKCR